MCFECPSEESQTPLEIGSIHDASEIRGGGCAKTFALPGLLAGASSVRLRDAGTNREVSDPGFVIYDLETTGLSANECEIIQIAAVRYRGAEIVRSERFSTYVRPLQPIPYHITALTGVANHHVRNAPSQKEALLAFSQFVGEACLVAHNGLRFDSKFLAATCCRQRLTPRQVRSIDSIHLSQRMFGKQKGLSHGMDAVLSRLRLSTQGHTRHDARGDVELLAQMVQVLHRHLDLDLQFSGIRTHLTTLPAL